MPEVTLIQGTSYTYKGKVYKKGVPASVPDKKTHDYLIDTGRFGSGKVRLSEKGKPIFRRNRIDEDDAEPDVPATKLKLKKKQPDGPKLPEFKSKKELSDFAFKTYGVTLEGTTMSQMQAELRNVIATAEAAEADEESVPVK